MTSFPIPLYRAKSSALFRLFFCLFLLLLLPLSAPTAHADGRGALHYFNDTEAGRAAFFSAASDIYVDSPAAQPAKELLSRLTAAAGLGEVHLLLQKKDTINAYSLPGHVLVLNEKALQLPEAELAVLLAHELGHIAHDDPVQILQKSPRAMSGLRGLCPDADGNYKKNSAKKILHVLPYGTLTQKEERQADEYASRLLQKAGFPPEGAAALFRRLEREYGPVARGDIHLSWSERRTIYDQHKGHL